MKKPIVSILNSILVIATAAILVGSGTWAFFSDTEKSPIYSAVSARLDLKISDDNEGGGRGRDGVTDTWVMDNALPGVTTSGSMEFRNAGTIDADHLEIGVSNNVIDPPGPESDTEEGTTDMDKVVQITKMDYTAPDFSVVNCLTLLTDANGNGFIDLDDLEAQGLDNLRPPLRSNLVTSSLDMSLKFHESADNDYQGDSLFSEFAFTLNQDTSQ